MTIITITKSWRADSTYYLNVKTFPWRIFLKNQLNLEEISHFSNILEKKKHKKEKLLSFRILHFKKESILFYRFLFEL